LTKGEQSRIQDGKAVVVLHSRHAFQDTMQPTRSPRCNSSPGDECGVSEQQPHRSDVAVEVIPEPEASDALEPAAMIPELRT
jgi:hypothetical protein